MSSQSIHKPYVIVFGNEKGGTGKSTLSMHIIIHLLHLGYRVGSVDIDARQGTLSRYFENRVAFNKKNGTKLPMPEHYTISKSDLDSKKDSENEENETFDHVFKELQCCDFIVMDTPGNDTNLSRYAHSFADTLFTPINDSFVDLDVIMRMKSLEEKKILPSPYAEMVWNQKKKRLMRDRTKVDWIVVRNRLSTLMSRNKKEMWEALSLLSNKLGFRVIDGFSERVIFRELFLKGLTLIDQEHLGKQLKISHIAARQELRVLLYEMNLPDLSNKLKEVI